MDLEGRELGIANCAQLGLLDNSNKLSDSSSPRRLPRREPMQIREFAQVPETIVTITPRLGGVARS
jgi:hypothetical protein